MENLATIQRVKNVRPCPNSDKLDLVQVLGWQVVTKRDEYKEGDLTVYIVIDTILPEKPEFEFLRNKNFRIKPIRLRGEESAGICFPLSIVPKPTSPNPANEQWMFTEGEDVTDLLGIKHYEKPIPAELAGKAVGSLPGFLIMTDEKNLRSYPDAVPEMYARPFYITRKVDGSSGTFFIKGGEFGVCSRKIQLLETEGNGFWKMARKYDLENVLKAAFPNTDMAIQGEVVGPGIQKNRLGLAELELQVFNLFDISNRVYLDYAKITAFCQSNGIPMVHTIEEGSSFHYTLEELVKLANSQLYYILPDKTVPGEGIVIRPQEGFYSPILKKTWSGKVISENNKESE